MKVSRYLADFDSSTAMMRALGRFLCGKDYPMLGQPSPFRAPLTAVNWLPRWGREKVYIAGGWIEAIPWERIHEVSSEQIAEWVIDHYPPGRYPVVMIGSSSGALTHIAAAMRIPWLPQTFLIPIRHHGGVHPDEPRYALEAFRRPAEVLLSRNPDLQLHHMHDSNQDRLMIQTMGYFRVKRTRLGPAWEWFLEKNLTPGGIILIVECGLTWPSRRVADRYYFQYGAVGGLTPEEYYKGSPRVEEYLTRHGSHNRQWDPPEPDTDAPEAEWGFEPALRSDIERFAKERGYQVHRLCFRDPADPSPVVAEFHRHWYERRNLSTSRLIVESFILMEPWWVLRTGSIPFWMVFNKQPSADSLASYLEAKGPFEELYLMIFNHGVNSVGLVSIEQWRHLLDRATKHGDFLGIDPAKYPRDFATFIRYHTDFRKKIRARYPMPEAVSLQEVEDYFKAHDGRLQIVPEASGKGGMPRQKDIEISFSGP
jgi:hypothetical protein